MSLWDGVYFYSPTTSNKIDSWLSLGKKKKKGRTTGKEQEKTVSNKEQQVTLYCSQLQGLWKTFNGSEDQIEIGRNDPLLLPALHPTTQRSETLIIMKRNSNWRSFCSWKSSK